MLDFFFLSLRRLLLLRVWGFFFLTTPYLHKEPEKPDDTISWLFSATFATRGCRVV